MGALYTVSSGYFNSEIKYEKLRLHKGNLGNLGNSPFQRNVTVFNIGNLC
jgi:hypothetical protein